MPAFGYILGDDEIRAVLLFIKSAWPPEIRAPRGRRPPGPAAPVDGVADSVSARTGA